MEIWDWLPVFVTAVACGISFFAMRKKMDRPAEEGPEKLKNLTGSAKPVLIYGIVMWALTVGVSIWLVLFYIDNTALFTMKRVCLLSVMWPVALTDLKSYRIPNIFALLGLIYWFIIFGVEFFIDPDQIWSTVLAELVACGVLLLAAFLCKLMIKGSIGLGDIKLLAIMGLMLGTDGIWGAIFMTLVISFFVSVFLLITKKKTRKDTIPFGPALVLGTYLSICLTGM